MSLVKFLYPYNPHLCATPKHSFVTAARSLGAEDGCKEGSTQYFSK